ncbi:MAG: hypothetical protein HGB26_06250, partial [Desulfobulbaceae bacterium]|nr:hypothetical protein [Desulfobulbaceae bacterium]
MKNNTRSLSNKLFKLKEWVTVPEAARKLSLTFDEEVTEADLYRFALEGHLKLSVNFSKPTKARCGKVIPYDGVEESTEPKLASLSEVMNLRVDVKCNNVIDIYDKFQDGVALDFDQIYEVHDIIKENLQKLNILHEEYDILKEKIQKSNIPYKGIGRDNSQLNRSTKRMKVDARRYLEFDGKVVDLQGIWDLAMIGSELTDIDNKFREHTDNELITQVLLKGAFVEGKGNVMAQLLDSYDNNKYQPGSTAERMLIESRIAKKQIDENMAEKVLKCHKNNRSKYLSSRSQRDPLDDFFPTCLPSNSMIVIRTEALRYLEDVLSDEEHKKEKPLGTKEKENLYKTIIAMAVKG